MGKTYQSEQYIVSKLLESKVEFPEIIIFLTEKTVLLNSTYGNIYSKLKNLEALDTANNRLFSLKKTTNESSTKAWKSVFKDRLKQNCCFVSTYSYFCGDRLSFILASIVELARVQKFLYVKK